MVDTGFTKAQSDNLPCIDPFMVASYLQNNPCFTSAEIKGVKASSASREQYGDTAIGYVQVKRENSKCTVKCKICPEHKVRRKQYNVTLIVDEALGVVEDVQCQDCAASAGGCKHAIASLMWIHRRSEEPACTAVTSYWRKSSLAKVGTDLKYLMAKDFGTPRDAIENVPSQFVATFVEEAKHKNLSCQLLKHIEGAYNFPVTHEMSLHKLLFSFAEMGGSDCDLFVDLCKQRMTDVILQEVERATRTQFKSELWCEMRFGRITASKAHAVSRCTTADGTLVETIIGAYKVPDTLAMKRGRLLESEVLSVLKKHVKSHIKTCGFFICRDYPYIGASPDGIARDFIVEIKCPSSDRTIKNYLVGNNEVSPQCKAQIQLQMFVTGKTKGVFCVADPAFATTKKINIIWVDFDANYTNELISNLANFWKQHIFPKLLNSVKM